LNNLKQSIGAASTLGLSGEAQEHATHAVSEMSNAYANGNKPGENEIQEERAGLGSHNPLVVLPAIKAAAGDLLEKVRADRNAMAASLPRGIKVPGYIDAAGADSFYKVTGTPVDIDLIVAPSGATQTVKSKSTGQLHYIDDHGNDRGIVPGQGAPSQAAVAR
jgi:hypothetical protein